jgi:D-xylose 1-dehydrogenase
MDARPSFARYPSLDGRVVFISGGASGIGAELVRQFCAQGARVAFIDLDAELAEDLVEAVATETSATPRFERCDVTDVAALQTSINRVAGEMGPIEVLINNAANDLRAPIEDVTPESWEASLAVNLRHHFFAAQAAIAAMRERRAGSIINLGSISWHVKLEGLHGYVASKAAIEGLTRVLARELGPDRIRVNCIIPGWVLTDRQRKLWLTPEVEADLMRAQSLKEFVTPEDVARLALWLAADDSVHCTGQNWTVDAGWM